VKLLPVQPENSAGVSYVGTSPLEGVTQLNILKHCGCRSHHRVLEIGCGALIAGYPIMQYLEPGHYTGLDPNHWLYENSQKIEEVAHTVKERQATLAARADFRAPDGEPFDYVLSHSILSHVSNDQLTEFFDAMAAQVAKDGTIAASIRLAEGNAFGSPGSSLHGDHYKEWQYPHVSWFRLNDVIARAEKAGLSAHVEPLFTQMILETNSNSVHDWLVLQHNTAKRYEVFHDWYSKDGRGSGPGSGVQYTERFRGFLEAFMNDHGIETVVDYGCGDWQWAQLVRWGDRTYTGFDIVQPLIERLNRQHATDRISFQVVDDVHHFEPPNCDLLICKDVLQHLPNAEAAAMVTRFAKHAKHILWVNDRDPNSSGNNTDTAVSGYRRMDLSKPPFSIEGQTLFEFGFAPDHKIVFWQRGGR